MPFFGLDLGATYLKGGILEPAAGNVGSVVRVPFPEPLRDRPPGVREISFTAILDAVRSVLRLLVAASPNADGLLVCGQMHGFVVCGHDGVPESNFVSWQDARTEITGTGDTLWSRTLREAIGEPAVRRAGNEYHAGVPLRVGALLAARGELRAGSYLASLGDAVLAALTGSAPVSHATNAAAHGCFDVERGEWDEATIATAGLARQHWPRIEDHRNIIGTLCLGADRVRVYPALGDQQVALAGARLSWGELSLNIATGSQVARLHPRFEPGKHQVRPYFDGLYLNTVTHIPAGRALNALVRLFSSLGDESPDFERAWARADAAAASVTNTDVEADIAFFPSSVGHEGSLRGLREDNLTPGHVMRAAMRAMARNYAACAARLPGAKADRLVGSGGLLRKSAALRSEIDRAFGLPWRWPDHDEDTLVGLVHVAQSIIQGTAVVPVGTLSTGEKTP